jgi:hypothetical protein
MRIVIVTDSLGIPREDTPIDVTWVSRIIKEYSNYDIYTLMLPALSIELIHRYKANIMNLYDPDIVIFQFGIVDATRRALPISISFLLSRMKIIGNMLRPLLSKHHYYLSSLFNIHKTPLELFRHKLNDIVDCKMKKTEVIFIGIMPAGNILKRRVFNIELDIAEYNKALFSHSSNNDNIHMIKHSRNLPTEKYIAEDDGHHLTIDGHEYIYNSIGKKLKLLTNNG